MSTITQTDNYKKTEASVLDRLSKEAAKKLATRKIENQISQEEADLDIELQQSKLNKQVARLSNKQTLATQQDAYIRENSRIKSRDSLARMSFPLLVLSIISAIISTLMSLASISHLHDPEDLVNIMQTKYWIPACIMGCLQLFALICSIISYGLKLYYKGISSAAFALRLIIFTFSVVTNHTYLCSIIPEYSNPGYWYVIGWGIAGGADIMSMVSSSWSTRLKFRMYDYEDIMYTEKGVFSMLWSNLTYNITKKITLKYKENVQDSIALHSGKLTKTNLNDSKPNVVTTACARVYNKNKKTKMEKYRSAILQLEANEPVNASLLNLDQRVYRKVRDYFVKEGLLYTDGKITKRSSNDRLQKIS